MNSLDSLGHSPKYSYINIKISNNYSNSPNYEAKKLKLNEEENKAYGVPSYNLSKETINYNHANLNLKNDLNINLNEYLKTEADDMDYDDAIKKDKRKFCEFFSDKLKSNQIILNTFYYVEPLKPRTIKILLFILDLDLYLVVNALFFNEEYISLIFNLKKKETFFSFVPRSIDRFLYTTLVSAIVDYIIECFFIEEKKIKGILKREKESEIILKYEITQVIKTINKRFKYFIILSFTITILSLYYIFCFNNIYPHMKGEWIKSSIIIIIIMQILSILACLLESILRFISFRFNSEKIFRLSLLFS